MNRGKGGRGRRRRIGGIGGIRVGGGGRRRRRWRGRRRWRCRREEEGDGEDEDEDEQKGENKDDDDEEEGEKEKGEEDQREGKIMMRKMIMGRKRIIEMVQERLFWPTTSVYTYKSIYIIQNSINEKPKHIQQTIIPKKKSRKCDKLLCFFVL